MLYSYNKVINSNKLKLELTSLNPNNIETVEPDILNIYFEEELSIENKSILDSIVLAHDPEVVVAPLIPDVTPRQIRQALFIRGITEQMIDEALMTLSEPDKTLATIEWKHSTSFQRNHPLVSTVGIILGWTEEQLNDLWILAGTL